MQSERSGREGAPSYQRQASAVGSWDWPVPLGALSELCSVIWGGRQRNKGNGGGADRTLNDKGVVYIGGNERKRCLPEEGRKEIHLACRLLPTVPINLLHRTWLFRSPVLAMPHRLLSLSLSSLKSSIAPALINYTMPPLLSTAALSTSLCFFSTRPDLPTLSALRTRSVLLCSGINEAQRGQVRG